MRGSVYRGHRGGHFQVPKVDPRSGRSHRICRATELENRGGSGLGPP